MSSSVIEIRHRFDPVTWQVHSSSAAWSSTAEALCDLGPCWFAGDDGTGTPVTTLHLRRKLSRRLAPVFRVSRALDLSAAFESGSYDWSMAAQWIVVADESEGSPDRIVEVLRTLLEDWSVPIAWPGEVSAIVQAGVDGDAAGCHCRTGEVERELREALQRHARANGVAVQAID